jgi:hypothetical protein
VQRTKDSALTATANIEALARPAESSVEADGREDRKDHGLARPVAGAGDADGREDHEHVAWDLIQSSRYYH